MRPERSCTRRNKACALSQERWESLCFVLMTGEGRGGGVGGIAQSVVCWLAALPDAGFVGSVLFWASSRVGFSLGVSMVSDTIPPKLFWMRLYSPRSSLFTHTFHYTDFWDSDIHVLDGWMPATKTHSTLHHPRRRDGTTSMVGLKMVT